MRPLFKALGLLLLLMVAQQGAVVHELSHVTHAGGHKLSAVAGALKDGTCSLCPAFAQVVTPAFSHSFSVPLLGRTVTERSAEPGCASFDADAPRPRSRGPPSYS